MRSETIKFLNDMNASFYRSCASSFADTRKSSWQGWDAVSEAIGLDTSPEIEVLDLACGTFRFEEYLAKSHPKVKAQGCGIDSCDALAADTCPEGFSYLHSDIISELIAGRPLQAATGSYDLVSCFGFMHHVPSAHLRQTLMAELLRCCKPGGYCALSFWCFMEEEGLARKAHASDASARERFGDLDLEPSDHFVGWNAQEDVYRYCHSFSDEEIDALVAELPFDYSVAARFRADGRNHRLNAYLVLKRRG